MDASRHLFRMARAGAVLGLLLLAAGLAGVGDLAWFAAHGRVLLGGFVLPLLAAAHVLTLERLAATTLPARPLRLAGAGMLAGAVLSGLALLPDASAATDALAVAGLAVLAAGATLYAVQVMKRAPRSGLADPERPLTKGDDACLKHVHFAHRFLPLGLLLLVAAAVLGAAGAATWQHRFLVAGQHVLLVGYGLLSLYALGHFWVPRFSGVPAIAAGAIKGELHTTLLGLTGLVAGFLTGLPGLTLGLGFFVFVGFFTYMGVLGANIMRNKSRTQRVTPRFVYIPWTFTGIFWLISAVLLGLFLNAVPDVLSDRAASLRYTHVHAALWGGLSQLLLSWAIPVLAEVRGTGLPRFDGRMKGAFYAYNGGLALALWSHFTTAPAWAWWTALALALLGLLLYGASLAGPRRAPAPAAT